MHGAKQYIRTAEIRSANSGTKPLCSAPREPGCVRKARGTTVGKDLRNSGPLANPKRFLFQHLDCRHCLGGGVQF
eukprot:5925522-Pyramimonas_sp.AAC.1